MRRATERRVLTVSEDALRGGHMMTRGLHRVIWLVVAGLLVYLSLPGVAQQATQSDADLIRQGPLALAAAHGEQPRRGGKFLSAGNEKLPHFDMHQTSFGGVYAATALSELAEILG
jgi:hypothetical protein